METSFLESTSQKILYTILYLCKQSLDGEKVSHNSLEDDDITKSFEDAIKLVIHTQRGGLNYIDIDFILNLYILNFDKINGPKDFVELTIPQSNDYSFEVEVDEMERVVTTYKHSISSYSKYTVSPMIELQQKDGNLEYYDGRVINREVVDSDFNDYNINYKSIKEVSPKK